MKPVSSMTQLELGAFVQSHLADAGIHVVLSGGAAVSWYSNGRYVSRDLDLVNVEAAERSKIAAAMRAIGFVEEGRHFVHPETKFFVEFPPGPLAVGAEIVGSVEEIRLATGLLRAISSTDCVKDRLAHYFHWNDRQSLAQALLVAESQPIDLGEIARWCEAEGMGDQFRAIRDQIVGAQGS